MTSILVIDNYDSFVYTLNGYLRELGAETTVLRNDAIEAHELESILSDYDGVLVSPGPGNPKQAGVSLASIGVAHSLQKPLLGVCLGHQAIAEYFGATVTNASELMHGKTSLIRHDDSRLFTDVPQDFQATRYHSLAVVSSTVPSQLTVTARTPSSVIMAIEHVSSPLFGVQFHPESVLTEHGYVLLANWLDIAGLPGVREAAIGLSPVCSP